VVKQTAKQDLRAIVQQRLVAFGQGDLTECSLALFQSLGYQTDKRLGFAAEGAAEFLAEMNGRMRLSGVIRFGWTLGTITGSIAMIMNPICFLGCSFRSRATRDRSWQRSPGK
jgi:hypothetical protein